VLLHEICEFIQYRAYFWELVRVSYLSFYYFPKIAKEHAVLFLISTLNDGDAIRSLLLLQYPQFMQPLNLMRVFCVFLALGKLGYDEVFSFFDKRRPAYFFRPSKVPSTGDSLMSCCSNFFDNRH
jgi:hypothetical protein